MRDPKRGGEAAGCGFSGTAFGMALHAAVAIPGIADDPVGAPAPENGTRLVHIVKVDDDAGGDPRWSEPETERPVELTNPDGRRTTTLDVHPRAGYRLFVEGLGRCELTPDGRRILCVPPAEADLRWRLLTAQALPFAAALQGLEVLHASAVAVDGAALVFCGDSGMGKTSLALDLLAHGATFLADDVVALESDAEQLLVHPGAGLANVPDAQGETKATVAITRHPRPTPLRGLYFLMRLPEATRTEIVDLETPEPLRLLASTFVLHVLTPRRRLTQLDICAQLARTVPVHEIRSPLHGEPSEVAGQVAAHLGAGR